MALTATLVRPDRVYATGVVAPYPIRQESPVAIARGTLDPFLVGVRQVGPTTLGNAGPALRAARAYSGAQPKMGRFGARPIPVAPRRPVVGSRAAAKLVQGMRDVAPGQFDAARSMHALEKAFSVGNVWDITFARQRQLYLGR
jgi:hypothetical protein